MNKSTSLIFAFIFFLVTLSISSGKGGDFGFQVFPGVQKIDNEAEAKKGSLQKAGDKPDNPGKLSLKKQSEEEVESKTINVGMELTKALFGKYLKKEE